MLRNRTAMLILAALLSLPSLVRADNSCSLAFEPTTSGFMLNPILDRLVVTSAKASTKNDLCPLRERDEIVQVNQQRVPGQRALAVMKYWKSIKAGVPVTYHVKRGASMLVVESK